MEINRLERAQIKKELIVFLVINFAVTYLFQILLYIFLGIATFSSPFWALIVSSSMFIPAFVAIFCMFLFKSPVLTRQTKIIFAIYIIYVVAYFICLLIDLTELIFAIIAVLGMITVIILNLKKKWRDELVSSKLSFGKGLKYYIIIPVILIAIYIFSYILNYALGFGKPIIEFNLSLFSTVFPLLIYAFFVSWVRFFGEEYGWRVYLQDRLFPLFGGYKGVLILGIIWGLWHAPLVTMGWNYPGANPVIANLVFILYTIIVGIIFSYAVLKAGSVWIAVILHLIIDTMAPYLQIYISSSIDSILSFGIGIYGIALLGIFALVLLRSKVWKKYDIPKKEVRKRVKLV